MLALMRQAPARCAAPLLRPDAYLTALHVDLSALLQVATKMCCKAIINSESQTTL